MSRRWRLDDEAGSVSVLTLGWIVLALLALLVMAAASQVHIDRTRLASLADEVALVATNGAGPGGYFGTADSSRGMALDEAAMEAAAADWLAQDPRPWVSEVVVLDVTDGSDGTAIVQLGRTVTPLFELEALGSFNLGIDLTVEGRARAG